MTSKPAIVALLATLLLAVLAFFALRTPGEDGGSSGPGGVRIGERAIKVDPGAVESMTLAVPGKGEQRMERDGQGRWWWHETAESRQRYMLEESRARALFMLMEEAKGVAAAPGKTLAQTPAPVVLTMSDGKGATTVRMAPRGLGGQVQADIETTGPDGRSTMRSALIADELLTVLTSPGPSAWRDPRVIGDDPGLAERITFTDSSGTKGFTLNRQAGRWILSVPAPVSVTCPASIEGASAVVRAVASLTVSRFFDGGTQPSAATAGLESAPSGVLELEFGDRWLERSGAARSETRLVRLVVGQPADTKGSTLYGTLDSGVTIVGLDAPPLARLTLPPTELASRRVTEVLEADVGVVRISVIDAKAAGRVEAVELSRADGGTWQEQRNGSSATQDVATAAATSAMLKGITTGGCDAVAFTMPVGTVALGEIELRSAGGEPLDRLVMLRLPTGGVVFTQPESPGRARVYRTVNTPAAELTRWLDVLAR